MFDSDNYWQQNLHQVSRKIELGVLESSFKQALEEETDDNHKCILNLLNIMLSGHRMDGALFCKIFTAALIRRGIDADIPYTSRGAGYSLALGIVTKYLDNPTDYGESPHLRISLGDYHAISRVIYSIFCTRSSFLSFKTRDIDQIVQIILVAFLNTECAFQQPLIVYYKVTGTHVCDSCIYHDTLLMDLPDIDGFPAQGCVDCIVAVFDESLELPGFEEDSGLSSHFKNVFEVEYDRESGDTLKSMKVVEQETLDSFALFLSECSVNVLVTQKRMHPYLRRKLNEIGIACLPRLSIRYIGSLLRLAGAKQLGSFQPSSLYSKEYISCMGYLRSLCMRHIHGKIFIAAEGSLNMDRHKVMQAYACQASAADFADGVFSRRVSLSSMIIAAPTEAQTEELQSIVEKSFYALAGLADQPVVLPGAGIWQWQAAQHLEAYVSTMKAERTRRILTKPHGNDTFESWEHDEELDVLAAINVFRQSLIHSAHVLSGVASGKKSSFLYLDEASETGLFSYEEHLEDGEKGHIEVYLKSPDPAKNIVVHYCRRVDQKISLSGFASAAVVFVRADALDCLFSHRAAMQTATEAALALLHTDGSVLQRAEHVRNF